jgi:hypothetical protein
MGNMSGAECSPYMQSGECLFLQWYTRGTYASVCIDQKALEICQRSPGLLVADSSLEES